VTAALQEDVQGIAVSSTRAATRVLQYMIDLLRGRGGETSRCSRGGG